MRAHAACISATTRRLARLLVIVFLPGSAFAQSPPSTGEIGTFAEVLAPPARVETVATPFQLQSVASDTRYESRVRLASPQRLVLEVDGRRIDAADASATIDVVGRDDGTIERRYRGSAGIPTDRAGFVRELTVRFRMTPGVSPSTEVRVKILVGLDGAT